MRLPDRSLLLCFALAGFAAGCSGMGTTLTKVGRLGQNKGYEVAAQLPAVQLAASEVLKAHGYEVSLKAAPENGAEAAGQIVIGQKLARYDEAPGSAPNSTGTARQLETRDLVNVYLSKKWQMSGSQAAPNITLVEIVGGSTLRKSPGSAEVETPLAPEAIALLRDEIERSVDVASSSKAAAK